MTVMSACTVQVQTDRDHRTPPTPAQTHLPIYKTHPQPFIANVKGCPIAKSRDAFYRISLLYGASNL
jgi:hypothetical protein